MTVTITAADGSGTTSPILILSSYSTAWVSRNIVHPLIGGGIAVTHTPPSPRAGTLELLYETEPLAFDCAELHGASTTFALLDDQSPDVAMTYVVVGEVRVSVAQPGLPPWTVTVGYQAVDG